MARPLPKSGNLFESDPEPIDDEVRQELDRVDFHPDQQLARWCQVQPTSHGEGSVRVARFKNGCRGVSVVRGQREVSPAFVGSLTLQPEEYYSLAQCVFRDSHLVRELLNRFPEGTDDLADRIRDFLRDGK